MQTNATFSVVISTKNCWRAPKLRTDSSLKFPCCRLLTNKQYITSSRLMNHVIAANQPLHWLRLFHDINGKVTYYVCSTRDVKEQNNSLFGPTNRGYVPSRRSTSFRALAAEPVRQNANGTYAIEANTESHRGLH